MGGGGYPGLYIWGPVVFVDIQSSGSDLLQRVCAQIDYSEALLINRRIDDSGERRHGLKRSGYTRHAFDEEDGKPGPIRRKARGFGVSLQVCPLGWSAAVASG